MLPSAPTSAQTITFMGGIKPSCGSWTQARANHQSADMEFWAMGFVSGANVARAKEDAIDIPKDVGDAEGLLSWIDNYCRSKPLELFPIAAAYLVIRRTSAALVRFM